jgi:hypothetical protein
MWGSLSSRSSLPFPDFSQVVPQLLIPESTRQVFLRRMHFTVLHEPWFIQFIKKIKAEKGYERIGAVGLAQAKHSAHPG